MASRKLILCSLFALALTACATGAKDDDDASSDSVAATDSKATTKPDANDTESASLDLGDKSDASNGVNPDLAQDTLTDDLESELNSASLNEVGAKTPSMQDQAGQLTPPAPPPAPLTPPPQETIEPPQSSQAAAHVDIKNIRYVANANGGSLVVETSAPATYRTREVAGQNQFVIEIANAKLPARLKRPFLTKDFKQAIASIDAYQDAGSTTARIVVQFRGPSSANVVQNGSVLTLAAQGAGPESAPSNVSLDENQPEATTAATDHGTPFSGQDEQGGTTKFYGKPISIEVRETNIRDVLNLIAEQSGANIVVADDVTGNVTLKLKQVPWDQALLIIMKSKNLSYVREGSVLRIALATNIQRETEALVQLQNAKQLTEPLRVRMIPVSYAKVEDLVTQVGPFLSTRGKVVADKRTTSIVVTDIIVNLERVTNLVKALDTPPTQVLIEGKIVEAREDFSRNLGIAWGGTGQPTNVGGKTLNPNFNIDPGNVAGNGASVSLTYGTLDLVGDLTARLNLFENTSLANVLSSPRIVVLNNEPANIRQVQQVPIPTTTQTVGAPPVTSYTFKPVELLLSVTPQITSASDVILAVNVKREFTTAPVGGVPADVETREATTKVMVKSGQTAVIGGIYQNDDTKGTTGVPFLKDVPVVGWLFKGETKNRHKNELLLFLTPRILKPGPTSSESPESLEESL